jgi:branched-chain amino acid aminotransferase
MINFNGKIVNKDESVLNRSFLYGDALFDTLLVKNGKIVFLKEHYFRLVSGIRQLRMEIPIYFTQYFWEIEIRKILIINEIGSFRVRTTIFRESDGLYEPKQQSVSFIIQKEKVVLQKKTNYLLGIYKDNYQNNNSIDNIKTTNRLINVLASIYAKENNIDNCLLLNNQRQIASVMNANIFAVFGKIIKTPPLSEGCINGIMRQKVIALINNDDNLSIQENTITPSELQNAEEIFITNSIIGIQSISEFKKKTYPNNTSNYLQIALDKMLD